MTKIIMILIILIVTREAMSIFQHLIFLNKSSFHMVPANRLDLTIGVLEQGPCFENELEQ